MISKILRAYVRHYSDSGQLKAYIEWTDTRGRSGRTEGRPASAHMLSLLARAKREGIPITKEQW